MSGKGGGGNNGGKGSTGISGIPVASRKMVQSLKEIVNNCTEQEIYAALSECDMDPNEAVNRLLSQDPFHEVKSKREKKKENKDTSDSRSRGPTISSNRGSKGGMDRYAGRGGSTQSSFTDTGVFYGKPSKKENGTHAYTGSSSSASGVVGHNMNWQASSQSETAAAEYKVPTLGVNDGMSLSSQSSGYQSAWLGVPGQVSMADIVKMGRPHGKAYAMQNPAVASPSTTSQDNASKVSGIHDELGISSQHASADDEWPAIEHPPAADVITVLESHVDSELYSDAANQYISSQVDDAYTLEDEPSETIDANHVRPASVSGRSVQEDGSGVSSAFDSNLYTNQPHMHGFECDEREDGVSSISANLQQLTLQKDDQDATSEEDNPSVVIPDHLQLHTPDCFQLSFGSFGSGTATFSGSASFTSRPLNSNLEETSVQADISTLGHAETRNPEYYEDEHLGSTSDGSLIHITAASSVNYDSSATKPEGLNQGAPDDVQADQYAFPSSSPGFTYESNHQENVPYSHQMSSQMQNLTPFSSVMQQYSNSLPSTLLASTVQTVREDFPYSPFPVTQSMPAKYNNVASSITGPTISMSEALRAGSISNPQPTQQALPNAAVATGPALPQHLAVHPYSQPSLPIGHFANMISYPFLPQSYTYMPSAFQQAFAGNSTYHQSLAAVLPQYKNNVSVSMPQSAAVAGFGSSTSIPGGNYPLNPPTAPTNTTIGYDDVLSSQFKDNSHLLSLQQQQQQTENSAIWVHGAGSRTMSAVPASTYYGFQGQNQQPGAFRQGQQPSQHFGALGYPNFYHSQTGISMEHQQQNPREASLGGSQGQPPKQSQLIWQNSY